MTTQNTTDNEQGEALPPDRIWMRFLCLRSRSILVGDPVLAQRDEDDIEYVRAAVAAVEGDAVNRIQKALNDQFAGIITAHEFVGVVQQLMNWKPDGPFVELEGSTGPVNPAASAPLPAEPPPTWIDNLVGLMDDSLLTAEVLENERRAREAMDAATPAQPEGEQEHWTSDACGLYRNGAWVLSAPVPEVAASLARKLNGHASTPPETPVVARTIADEVVQELFHICEYEMFCEHANEVPAVCPCRLDCYCKTHTCKSRVPETEARCPACGGTVDEHLSTSYSGDKDWKCTNEQENKHAGSN